MASDLGQSETSAVYCHCYEAFNCKPAVAFVEDMNGVRVPLCAKCAEFAFERGRRVGWLPKRVREAADA